MQSAPLVFSFRALYIQRFESKPRKGVDSKLSRRMLNRTSNSRLPGLSAFACAARALVGIGRFLLLLTAILLVTSPLTQHIWVWDHFLHGGQDYESTMLMVLAILCLALVLAQCCKQSVNLLLAARRLFSVISPDLLVAGTAPVKAVRVSWKQYLASPGLETSGLETSGLETYSLPLQI
jgi:hypothetical protein